MRQFCIRIPLIKLFILAEKCSAANTNWACCTEENKCGPMQGDCDHDYECQDGLICGDDNCPGFPDDGYDCCVEVKGK